MDSEEIDRVFKYYRGDPSMIGRFEEVRETFTKLAHRFVVQLPPGPEAEQAVIHLDEAMRWVFAGMIRPPRKEQPDGQ